MDQADNNPALYLLLLLPDTARLGIKTPKSSELLSQARSSGQGQGQGKGSDARSRLSASLPRDIVLGGCGGEGHAQTCLSNCLSCLPACRTNAHLCY